MTRRTRPPVLVERVTPDVPLPVRATEGSAAYDVLAWIEGRPVEVVRLVAGPTGSAAREAVVEIPACGRELVLGPGERAKVPTGLRLQPPAGWVIDVRARSGLSWTEGVTLANGVGTGDMDFPGEYCVLLVNHSRVARTITHGHKIAQLLFHTYETPDFVEGPVRPVTRRTGGFGHTGR